MIGVLLTGADDGRHGGLARFATAAAWCPAGPNRASAGAPGSGARRRDAPGLRATGSRGPFSGGNGANHVRADQRGTPSTFTCPECGGALREPVDGELLRCRCHGGHAFTAESALESQDGVVEQSLWAAVRALQESATMARRVGARVALLREDLERRAEQNEAHAEVIRQLLAGR